jgi:hypothetical protein
VRPYNEVRAPAAKQDNTWQPKYSNKPNAWAAAHGGGGGGIAGAAGAGVPLPLYIRPQAESIHSSTAHLNLSPICRRNSEHTPQKVFSLR